MIKLSKRMQAVADLVTPGNRVADIGTDHGYLPIYLVEQRKCPYAIAMDINYGPLKRAEEHIEEHGLQQYIDIRQSDGTAALQAGEADSLIIGGMGGKLVVKILEEGKTVLEDSSELVLQPQSELEEVRRYLKIQGYVIMGEEMVAEEGKYYPIMKVELHPAKYSAIEEDRLIFQRYGKELLKKNHPVLREYLEKEFTVLEKILKEVDNAGQEPRITKRREEILTKISYNREARKYMKKQQ